MTLKEQIELQRKYNNINSNEYIKIYSYENHDIKEQQINGYISYDIINYIVNNENSVLKNDLEKIIPSDFLVYYSSHYFKDDYDIDYYLMRKSKDEIYNFILNNVNNNVDMNKEFLQLEVSFKGMTYNFTTNNVSEFKDILDNKGKELENDSEYQEYLKEKQLTENDNYNYSYVDEDNNYAY